MAQIVVVLLALVAIASATNYCNLQTCYDKSHTMCTFTSPAPSKECGANAKSGLTDDEKQRLLNFHNELRQKVANGEETQGNPGPQPPTTEMATLEWDDELATVAQRWANQCDWGHDECRDVDRYQVGQNIGMKSTTGDVNSIKIEDVAQAWYDEVKHYDGNDVNNFNSLMARNGKVTGHYTQFVWGKTNKLGCGAVKYSDGEWNNFYLVCNYGPSGNFFDSPVYETY